MSESAPEQTEQAEQQDTSEPDGLEVVTTDVVVSSDEPELPAADETQADDGDVDPEPEVEEFEPHELDLPAPEDLPAPHAPYDPSHGAR